MRKPVTYELDGTAFSSLEEFATHFSSVVLHDYEWNGNLDALSDILRGGYGTPDSGFTIVWKHSAISRDRLGHGEAARLLTSRLNACHSSNRAEVAQALAAAQRGEGPTVFDWLVGIISTHGNSSGAAGNGVQLILQD